MRLFILGLFFTISQYAFSQSNNFITGSGTAIVALITKDTIWIAADSKHTIRYEKAKDTFISINKIHNKDEVFFAFAGNVALDNDKYNIHLDVYKIMDSVLLLGLDFKKSIDTFTSIITSLYNNVMKKYYTQEHFEIIEKGFGITLFIATINEYGPLYSKIDYLIKRDKDNKRVLIPDSIIQNTKSKLTLMGHYQKIVEKLSRPPDASDTLGSNNVSLWLTELIRLETSNAINSPVGMPVSVVVLYKNGHIILPLRY